MLSAFLGFQIGFKNANVCTSCRSRKCSYEYLLLSIYMYLLANIGFDISENGPLKVCHQLGNYLSNS